VKLKESSSNGSIVKNAEHDRAMALMITNLCRRERAYHERTAQAAFQDDRRAIEEPPPGTT